MKIKPQNSLIASICIAIAGIVLTSFLGLWTTESTKIPQKLKQEEYSNQYNPVDIRGSYTFLEISNLYHIPIKDLADAFLIKESEASEFKCKDLETVFVNAPHEIGTGSVRMFVAFYLGLPLDINEDTYIPDTAAEIVKDKAKMTSDQAKYLESHTVILSLS